MENYRKAKKGDITCEQCGYSHKRPFSNRIECLFATGWYGGYAVGRKMTCDCATDRQRLEESRARSFAMECAHWDEKERKLYGGGQAK